MSINTRLAQSLINVYHSYLDNICRRALYRAIHCHTFTKGSEWLFGRFQLCYISTSTKYGSNVTVLIRLFYSAFEVRVYGRIACKIIGNISLGLSHRYAEILRQRIFAYTVHNAEIDRFGALSQFTCNIININVKYLCRRARVNILTVDKRLYHMIVLGNSGKQAQLDLRIVGVNKNVSLIFGYEISAQLASKLCSDGNVLQVGLG